MDLLSLRSSQKRFQSIGILKYGPGLKAVLEIDEGIVKFYRSLIPKSYRIKGSRYKPHISVVRLRKEKPDQKNWGALEGTEVPFEYSPIIYIGGVYAWLEAYGVEIARIRQMLGLGEHRVGFNCYHITLGTFK